MKAIRIVAAAFLILGFVMFLVGYLGSEDNAAFFRAAETTQGTLVAVDSQQEECNILYQAEGQTYHARLNVYVSSMRVGESVTVYYVEGAPDVFRTEYHDVAFWILRLIGMIFGGIGLVMLLIALWMAERRRSLLEKGDRVTARITGVEENRSVKVNNRHPFRLVCEYTDPNTGETRVFRGGNIYCNPTLDLTREEVDVYLHPTRRNRYVVDEKSAM